MFSPFCQFVIRLPPLMRRMPDAWGGNAPVPVRKGQGSFAWSGRFPLAACGPPPFSCRKLPRFLLAPDVHF